MLSQGRDDQESWVYRAVAPDKFDPVTGKCAKEAFFLRRDEFHLSVYSSAVLSPREVLQKIIDGRLEKLGTKTGKEREDFVRYLQRTGDSVERLVEIGWKVV